jgi:uncharacterized membrane protein YccC
VFRNLRSATVAALRGGRRRAIAAVSLPAEDLLLSVKTAFAGGAAWAAGAQLPGSPSPVLASLAAVLVVQVTVYQTVRNGLQRVIGVVVGVVVALWLGRTLGFNAWSLALLLLVALLVGRMLRLGGQAPQVAVSALLVLAVGNTGGGYAQMRVFETLLGAAVGVVVNILVVPPVHVQAARVAIAAVAHQLARLLTDMGKQLEARDAPIFARERTAALLHRARQTDDEIAMMRVRLDRAAESLRYNPRRNVFISPAPKAAPAALLPRLRAAAEALDHFFDETNGIARALDDIADQQSGPPLDTVIAARLGHLLCLVGRAVHDWADALRQDDPDAAAAPSSASARQKVIESVRRAQRELASITEDWAERCRETGDLAGSSLTAASVLSDVARILTEIDPHRGPHRPALARTPAAHIHLPLRRHTG